MNTPLGAADFFALEAGEYLERLSTQIARPEGPAADEFMRFSRALRGSALMAKQSDIAHAAAGLEGVARKHREGTLAWSPAVREVTGQAVEELKLLVRAAGDLGEEHRARAGRVAESLAEIGGVPTGLGVSPPAPRTMPAQGVSAGVRAFVAREGALIASALNRAAHALQIQPSAKDPLETVIRRLQSLRGLAELSELTPLPEILDGIESATGDLSRSHAPPPQVADVFDAAAKAVTRISRDMATFGHPSPDSEEGSRFADLLFRTFTAEGDVVSVASLAPEDGQAQVVELGSARLAGTPTAVELVSHGEFLCQVAGDLRSSGSRLQRDLRLFGVFGSLRALSQKSEGALGTVVRAFGSAARRYIARGSAGADVAEFAASLDQAGDALRRHSAVGNEQDVIERLTAVTKRLEQGQAPAQPTPLVEPSSQIVPIGSLAPDGQAEPPGEIVPISSLAPDGEAAIAQSGADTTARHGSLATSFVTFARLMQERPQEPPALDAFLGRTPTESPADVVSISTLLYAGPRALDRAAAIREEITNLLARNDPWESVKPLVEELLDLVPLARGATP
jgi:chemotaxis protein histidine kinase CheA